MTSTSTSFSIAVSAPAPLGPPDYLVLAGAANSFTMRRLSDGKTWSGSKLNCRDLGVAPGQVIQFEAGLHGERCLVDVIGTAAKPIVVRSDPAGQVVIRRASGQAAWFVLTLDGFRYAVLDGSTTAGSACGFKVMYASTGTDAPSAFVKVGDSAYTIANKTPSSFFTLRHVENRRWLAGQRQRRHRHQHQRPRQPHLLGQPERRRPHPVPGEPLDRALPGQKHRGRGHVRGAELAQHHPDLPASEQRRRRPAASQRGDPFQRIDNTSWDMCNCKSWIAGDNRIHHNLMRRGSQALNPNQNGGITANNCHVKIYNNWVEKTGNPGIQTYMHQMPDSLPFGPFEAIIYNNVVCDLFTVPGDQEAKGINVGGEAGSLQIKATIYNNTVVDTPGAGIATNSGGAAAGCAIANNLVVDCAPIAGGSATLMSDLELALAAAGFVDGASQDFRLTASSPARNQAKGSHVATTDYLDAPRPQGSAVTSAPTSMTSRHPRPVPGEIIELAAAEHGSMLVRNLAGTASGRAPNRHASRAPLRSRPSRAGRCRRAPHQGSRSEPSLALRSRRRRRQRCALRARAPRGGCPPRLHCLRSREPVGARPRRERAVGRRWSPRWRSRAVDKP